MDTDILSRFGNHLRELRVERGLTQSELAFRGNFDRNYIGMVERGERNPSLKSLNRIAQALGVSLSVLLLF